MPKEKKEAKEQKETYVYRCDKCGFMGESSQVITCEECGGACDDITCPSCGENTLFLKCVTFGNCGCCYICETEDDLSLDSNTEGYPMQ